MCRASRISHDLRHKAFVLACACCVALMPFASNAAEDLADAFTECVFAPAPACFEPIGDRLDQIEALEYDPRVRARLQVRRVAALSTMGRPDEAEAVFARISTDPALAVFRDEAIVQIIAASLDAPYPRARRVLDEIVSETTHTFARASYISGLVGTGDLDLAMRELEQTGHPGAPLHFNGIGPLSRALAAAGRLDEALAAINAPGRSTEEREILLYGLVEDCAQSGRLDLVEMVLSQFSDPVWRLTSTSVLASVLSDRGDAARADEVFRRALAEMTRIDDPHQRRFAFDALSQAAVASGRVDIARTAAAEAGTTAFDHADALRLVILAMVEGASRADWRSLVADARAMLEGVGDDHRVWGDLAAAVAIAGDAELAAELYGRISDPIRRSDALGSVVSRLIESGRFDEALALLPLQDDRERRALGYLWLGRTGLEAGHSELAQMGILAANHLIDGPAGGGIGDYPISLLAELEAMVGQLGVAEDRLARINDDRLRINGRMNVLRVAAEEGSAEDFERLLQATRTDIAAIEDTAAREPMIQQLALRLLEAGRVDAVMGIALAMPESDARDRLFQTVASSMRFHGQYTSAVMAIAAISDPQLEADVEHAFYLDLLRASLAE
jgi:tetratricopeptide (TPR) repeat protein